MQGTLKLLAVGGLVLSLAGVASAQNVYVDTLNNTGNGAAYAFIGADPSGGGIGQPAASNLQAGYGVLPFTTSASVSGTDQVNQVQIKGRFMPPINGSGSSNLNSLYGVFIESPNTSVGFNTTSPNTGNSAKTVGGFFQFDTTPAKNSPTDIQGNGADTIFTANVTNGPALKAGTQYWLVVLPKGDLTPTTTSDSLARYFQFDASRVGANGLTTSLLTTNFAIEGQGLTEGVQTFGTSQSGGAQPGDTLANFTDNTANRRPLYFGARISASPAAVPETSTVISLGLGLVTMGGLALRRRKK